MDLSFKSELSKKMLTPNLLLLVICSRGESFSATFTFGEKFVKKALLGFKIKGFWHIVFGISFIQCLRLTTRLDCFKKSK